MCTYNSLCYTAETNIHCKSTIKEKKVSNKVIQGICILRESD